MSDGYTKLFGSIIHSTIWRENDHTRLVWITMLAMTNRHGEIAASVPGLADAARVTLEQCEQALVTLSSPDKYSRSKAYDGRRIAEIAGGWVLLNYQEYRDRISEENRLEKAAQRQQRWRERHGSDGSVTLSNAPSRTVTPNNPIAEAEAEADAKESWGDPQTPAPRKSRARKSPGRLGGETPYPDGFAPTPEHLARCKRDSLDPGRELEKFRNNALAKGLVYKVWNAAFSTWLMNAVEFRSRNGRGATVLLDPKDDTGGYGNSKDWLV